MKAKGTRKKVTKQEAVGQESKDKTLLHEKEFKRRFNYSTINEEEYATKLANLNIIDLCNEGLKHNVKVSSSMTRTHITTLLRKEFKENLIRLKGSINQDKFSLSKEEIEKRQRIALKYSKIAVG